MASIARRSLPLRPNGWRACLAIALFALAALPATAGAAARVEAQPAAGPAGSRVALHGAGYAPRSRVVVAAGIRKLIAVRASAAGRFTAVVRVPTAAHGLVSLVSRGGARRVVNRFRVSNAAVAANTSEIATQSGARLRWTPAETSLPAKLTLRATGLRHRARGTLTWAGKRVRVRSDRRGRLARTLALPSDASGVLLGDLRSGGQRLRFALAIGPDAPEPPDAPLPSPASPGGPPSGPPLNIPRRPPGPDPVVVAAGDIACDPGSGWFNNGDGTAFACRQKYTAALLSHIQPDAILGLGDYQYESGSLDAYQLSYDRSWGQYKSITYPAPANEHDQYGGGDWYAYWSSRLPAGTGPYSPYSFDIGTWHLISIPSACDNADVGGCGPGSRVEKWLKADLAAHHTACTLAYWHEPRWTSGPRHLGYTAVTPLIQDLYDAGADVIVNGANHNYERFAPQDPSGNRDDAKGIVEFIAGTGGKTLDQFGSSAAPNSVARNGSNFGVLQFVLHPNSYDWSFVPDVAGGYTDSGSRRCR